MQLMIDLGEVKITISANASSPFAPMKVETFDTFDIPIGEDRKPAGTCEVPSIGPAECERIAAFFESARRSLALQATPR